MASHPVYVQFNVGKLISSAHLIRLPVPNHSKTFAAKGDAYLPQGKGEHQNCLKLPPDGAPEIPKWNVHLVI